MEIEDELLDEENEKIISKLDETVGLSNNKKILRDIIRYNKVMQNSLCNIEFENYNIIIRNESYYNLYEDLISVIAEIYYKNGITLNKDIYYMTREDFRVNQNLCEKIKESIVVIDFNIVRRDMIEFRKQFLRLVDTMPLKSFIILENSLINGEINAALNDFVTWSMTINSIDGEEKEKYIKNFFYTNELLYSEEIVEELSDNPYYEIKNILINILVNCKINKNSNVIEILKKEKKKNKKQKNNISGIEELEKMIGLNDVKKQLKKVLNYIKLSKNRENMPMLHMCFNGNPGTGKTTVARIVGKIFAEENILSDRNVFVEAQRCDLIGKYVGHTAPQTQKAINSATGGVLFIDEAYSIASYIQDEGGRDFGAECIATLIKGMEDKRDNLCVILAGYTKEMQNMLKVNPGFESRISFIIDFPDFSSEELYEIFKNLCKNEKYKISSNVKKVLMEHFDKARLEKNFSNARYVRNIFEKVKIEQANRIINQDENVDWIKMCDILNVLNEITKCEEDKKNKIGFVA